MRAFLDANILFSGAFVIGTAVPEDKPCAISSRKRSLVRSR